MTKYTKGNKLTRKPTKNVQIMGEQIKLARLRRNLTWPRLLIVRPAQP